jgi:hypothetical protein
MKNALIVPAFALVLGVAACTNPYDPGQRALGGAAIGAGTGAAIGAAAGGGTGAAISAAGIPTTGIPTTGIPAILSVR